MTNADGPVEGLVSPRVLISYAHGDPAHEDQVRSFWLFLRANGIDARLDLPAAEERQDWPQWMTRQVREADPRLIQFTDALLRGGQSNLMHVQTKLQDLAEAKGISLRPDQPVPQVLDQAMILGSADILLTDLIALLNPCQADILAQVAVCRAPMTLDDLAYALTPGPDPSTTSATPAAGNPPDLTNLRADTARLVDLTLIAPGPEIVMHPWTADLVTRNTGTDQIGQHERALAMRLHRFQQRRGNYDDLTDIPRHLAALHRWDDIADLADQAIQILPGTLATVAYLAEIGPLVPKDEWPWIVVADREVDALLGAGDLTAATRQLQAIQQRAESLVAADPANAAWQRALSVNHNKLGDVAVAAGRLGTARDHYQAGLNIRVKLTAADPANTKSQRDLSVSHNKLGDVAVAAGDLTTARDHYQAGLDIIVGLAAADPANTGWQHDLSISHNKLGEVAVATGDLTTARDHYQAGLDIIVRLAAADPANTQWQRDLSVSHDRLGDVAVAAGDLDTARTAYRAGLDIATRLVTADPANTEWQRDLSVSHTKRGDLARVAGDLDTARTAYQAGLDIRTRLATTDPTNTQWQRDLSVSHERLGDVARAAGDLTAARLQHQARLDIAIRLAAADPANAEWQRDLEIARAKIAELGDSPAG